MAIKFSSFTFDRDSKLTGEQRQAILRKATKLDAPELLDLKNQLPNNTKLTSNLVQAVDAIANARFPKEWADLTA